MRRVLLALLFVLLAGPAWGQAWYPPNAWHPFHGGVNCVQVSDSLGFFDCSALITVDPTLGALSVQPGGALTIQSGGALTIQPGATVNFNTLSTQPIFGAFVLSTAPSTVAPTGPGLAGATLRVRKSPITPGYCQLVVAGGNGWGEFPIPILTPAAQLLGAFAANNAPSVPSIFDYFALEFPGGSSGC